MRAEALTLTFVALITSFCATGRAESFDMPVRTKLVDLGPSPDQPDYPNLHRHLSCYSYARFMVTQLSDDGNKGALRITITPTTSTAETFCTLAHHRGERVISDGWDYYWGVKGGLVFLIGADGMNGGMNFDVFNADSGTKIFKDYLLASQSKNDLEFHRRPNGRVSLSYRRMIDAKCSLLTSGATCWSKLKRMAGLHHSPMPRCNYSEAPDDPADPSVIFYPVKVDLFPRPSRRAFGHDVTCVAAE